MIKRTLRLVSLMLIIIGLGATDVMIPFGGDLWPGAQRVLAQSRKRIKSKKKKQTVRRRQSRRKAKVSAHRGQPRHVASSRRGRLRRSASAHRRRRRERTVPIRMGQQIPPERVLEIQRALIAKGFLKESAGVYDDATVEAMKAFQTTENIAVTGYPTAHALQRLGLPLGPTRTASATSEDKASPDDGQPQIQ